MSRQQNRQRPIHVLEIMGNAIVGGMEQSVLNFIRHLSDREFRLTVLCPFESNVTGAIRQMGCELYVTPMEDDPPWHSIQIVADMVNRQAVDVIHAHLPNAHVLGGIVSCLTGIPAVATVHGLRVDTQELGIHRTTGTHLIVVSRYAYAHALALGVYEKKLSLIYNGVELGELPERYNDAAFRIASGVPEEAPLVGFVGRLDYEKGPDNFVRAAKVVASRTPDVHFVIVGEGSMRTEIADMIGDLGLNDRIHMTGPQLEMKAVYASLNVLVQTSRSEGTPLVILESMAQARPVVAMGVGGVPELIEHGTSGFIAGPGDWEGIGHLLLELLDNPVRQQSMGRAARERAEALFDVRATAEQTANLLKQLASAQRTNRSSRPRLTAKL